MIREPEFQSLTPERKEVLYKLLCVEPDTLDRLTRATGWGRDVTQQTLLQLVADGRVSCKNGSGVRLYRIRETTRRFTERTAAAAGRGERLTG